MNKLHISKFHNKLFRVYEYTVKENRSRNLSNQLSIPTKLLTEDDVRSWVKYIQHNIPKTYYSDLHGSIYELLKFLEKFDTDVCDEAVRQAWDLVITEEIES
jgi:hypothetical protein